MFFVCREPAVMHTRITNTWETYSADFRIPDGKQAIYLVYQGTGTPYLKSFTLETE